jgi:hypothetical protein
MAFQGLPVWAVVTLAAACAGVLAVFHLLRIRRPQMRVITTLFWSLAVEAAPARSLWHRFRHPGTYALLLAIAALLVFALGRPEFTRARADATSAVVVLDAGMSMSSPLAERGGSRFDAARAAVLDEVRRYAADDEIAVLVLDPLPRVLLAFDEPRCVLAARLNATACAATPASRTAGTGLATALLQKRPRPQMVMVTDRPLADAASSAEGSMIETRLIAVGAPQDNAAVLDAVFEPREDNPLRGRLVATIGYWGAAPVEKRVLIEFDGATLHAETVRLDAGTTGTVAVEDLVADGRDISIRLPDPDAIAADNVAHFRLPRRNPIRVAVMGSPPDSLRALLTSDSTIQLSAADTPRDITLICDGSVVPENSATIRVRDDGLVLPATLGIDVVDGAPFTAGLSLQSALCAGPGLPPAAQAEQVLLRVRDIPLATLETDGGKSNLNLAAALFAPPSDAGRQPALMILLTRALRHLAGWNDDRASMPAERAQDDARWSHALGGPTMPQIFAGSRLASNVAQSATASATQVAASVPARWTPALFEWLLLAALLLLVVEAVLHARGRIV